ncbi:MAG: D-aminoacyl-tRNA deacylase [Candidatus Krumholzibacteriota bacterium]
MRCVVQRSGPALVRIEGETVGRIDSGLVVLAAFGPDDTTAELSWMARKLPRLRIFNDTDGKMNLSLRDVGGGILLVSQFTLYGNCRKGMRPSFTGSAPPERARKLYEEFGHLLRGEWPTVAEGNFGAMMEVELVNDGPVTLVVDREISGEAGSDD